MLKGVPKPFDLSETVTKSNKIHTAFLIFGWGMIGDVDVLSETMRYLGELRLYVAAAYFIIRRKSYHGVLRMKLANGTKGKINDTKGLLAKVQAGQYVNNTYGAINNDSMNANKLFDGEGEGENTESAKVSSNEGEWLTIEEDFLFIWVQQAAWAASTIQASPTSRLDDGVYTIAVANAMSRAEMLQVSYQ